MPLHIPDIDENLAIPTWDAVRRHLADQGLATTDAQIESLAFDWNGIRGETMIGSWFPGTRDHVLIILQAATPGMFYVCTPMRGVIGGQPYCIADEQAKATMFDM